MALQKPTADDLDSPWKEALEHFLGPFLAYFFPQVFDGIDWQRGYESLDKEFQEIIHGTRTGRRIADKLFKVWRKDGREAWLLIHIEVQGKRERNFPERMFIYSYRIYDLHRRPVVSLAVLCDDNSAWRPDHFETGAWGSTLGSKFLVAKLLDYRGREDELEQEQNPFAPIVLAHLKVLETRGAPKDRFRWKVRLVKGLYDRGLTADQVRQLFRLIDWMLQLPPELKRRFRRVIGRFEEERKMPYVTSVEEVAKAEVYHEFIVRDLEEKFGAPGKKLKSKVEAILDLKALRTLSDKIRKAKSLAEAKEAID